MRKLWTAFNTTLALGLAFSIGCGGGGGGSATPVTPVVYNGVTTQAVVNTAADVDALAGGALGSSQIAAVALAANTEAAAPAQGSLPSLVEVLRGVSALARPTSNLAAGATASQTVYGTCGGSATLSVNGSSTASSFYATGTFAFNKYCSTTADGVNVVIDGTMAATLNGTDADNFLLTLSTTRMNVTVGSTTYSYTITNYSCQVTAGYYGTVSLDCTYAGPAGGTYRVEGYQVLANASARTLVVQGRFYDYQRGYVDVTTPSPLTSTWCFQWNTYLPTSGALRVTGSGGVYGEFDPWNCTNYYFTIGNGVSSTQYLQTW